MSVKITSAGISDGSNSNMIDNSNIVGDGSKTLTLLSDGEIQAEMQGTNYTLATSEEVSNVKSSLISKINSKVKIIKVSITNESHDITSFLKQYKKVEFLRCSNFDFYDDGWADIKHVYTLNINNQKLACIAYFDESTDYGIYADTIPAHVVFTGDCVFSYSLVNSAYLGTGSIDFSKYESKAYHWRPASTVMIKRENTSSENHSFSFDVEFIAYEF